MSMDFDGPCSKYEESDYSNDDGEEASDACETCGWSKVSHAI
jgi:hypothetical protein